MNTCVAPTPGLDICLNVPTPTPAVVPNPTASSGLK